MIFNFDLQDSDNVETELEESDPEKAYYDVYGEKMPKSMSTLDFIGNWSVGANSYAIDSPNAVLVVDESEKQDTAILKLFKPVYDMDKKTLKYATTPDNATSIELLKEFGQSTIVIDQKVCSNKCLGL